MARLPSVGSDVGNWGTILNEFLQAGHRNDGSLKSVGNVVNVLDHGAIGNGDKENPADDTESINKAIAALENGSILYFPAGKVFKVTKALDVIGKENVAVTGGGTIKGVDVDGYIISIGSKISGTLQNCVMSHLKIIVSGNSKGGVKWFHAQSFVMDNVKIEDDFSTEGGIGVEIINGSYQGVIRHCKIHGLFDKGIVVLKGNEEAPFDVAPHGIHLIGCWLTRSSPARRGVGLSLEGNAFGVKSLFNYYESWDTGIDVTANAADGFKSISDTFEDDRVCINAKAGRVLVFCPNFASSDPAPEVGVHFSNGTNSSDGAVMHITRNVVPFFQPDPNSPPERALVKISQGCKRIRLDIEQALIDNNVVDNGEETAYYGQNKIRFGDVNIYRSVADTLKTDDKLIAGAGIGVGNSADATTLGTVKKKIEIFDANGNSLGFIPVYDSIS